MNLTIHDAARLFAPTTVDTPALFAAAAPAPVGRLIVSTQVWENYGTHTCDCGSDAECDCAPHWKAKGGDDYHIADIPVDTAPEIIDALVMSVRDKIENDSRFYHEYIVGFDVVTGAHYADEWGGINTRIKAPLAGIEAAHKAHKEMLARYMVA